MKLQPGQGLPKNFGRSTRRYRKLREQFKEQSAKANAPCWICNMRIDYTAKQGEPDAFNLDHYWPRSQHPELAEDPGNFRPSHELCNKARGIGLSDHVNIGQTSRKW